MHSFVQTPYTKDKTHTFVCLSLLLISLFFAFNFSAYSQQTNSNDSADNAGADNASADNKQRAIAIGIAKPHINLPADASKKVALVIGNSNYSVGPLTNPVNDAKDMAAMLKRFGFSVIEVLDLDKQGMENAVAQFAKLLDSADVGLFFFAGHGVQVKDRNYLIPVNSAISEEKDIAIASYSANDLMQTMQKSKVKTSIIILDACRNNPFKARSRSMSSGGLARMDAPTGAIVIYATAPGKTASDGKGDNGLFTGNLLKHMQTPGASIYDIAIATRRAVMENSKGKQVPWELSSLVEQFYFQASDTQLQLAQLSSVQVANNSQIDSTMRPLTLLTSPKNAKVTIINSAQEYSPGMLLPQQRYQIKLEAPGFESMVKSIDLSKQSAYEFILNKPLNDQRYKVDGVEFSMIAIPGGEFTMGCERRSKTCPRSAENPQQVYVDGFRLMETETTVALYNLCIEDGNCSDQGMSDEQFKNAQHPITRASFNEITEAFIPWLEYKTGSRFHLPSEAQWEYALRGDKNALLTFKGRRACNAAQVKRYQGGNCPNGAKPIAVKSFKSNGFGIFDLQGNAAELVQDCYTRDLASVPLDGSAQNNGDCKKRMYRGGSFNDSFSQVHPLNRRFISTTEQKTEVGFRLAQSANMITL